MAEANQENEIIEGFLCPICKTDLKNLNSLKTHFQNAHPEDQDVLKSLKDLFGKATKKILKLDEEFTFSRNNFDQYDVELEYQEVGYTKTHTKYFKAVRCSRLEHFATETNKLIIRLDQLLRVDASTDRRQREQEIVEWLDGSSVKLCPNCAKSFNLTRRQHHCRVCGSIMCHACTTFMSYNLAKTIISGIESDSSPPAALNLDETNSLRLCIHCMDLLEGRRRLQCNRNVQPIICDLYHQLCSYKKKIEPDIELYRKMCSSLHAGESTYSLADTQTLRGSLAKQAEALDFISKKISSIPLNPNIPRAQTLQNAIRRCTSTYIKESVVSLPALPTHAELLEKRSKYQIQTRISPQGAQGLRPPVVSMHSGWSPVVASDKFASDSYSDPLIEQMNIVKGYIKQARTALRFEEVASLESHLRELEEEFYQQSLADNQFLGP